MRAIGDHAIVLFRTQQDRTRTKGLNQTNEVRVVGSQDPGAADKQICRCAFGASHFPARHGMTTNKSRSGNVLSGRSANLDLSAAHIRNHRARLQHRVECLDQFQNPAHRLRE